MIIRISIQSLYIKTQIERIYGNRWIERMVIDDMSIPKIVCEESPCKRYKRVRVWKYLKNISLIH